ncbi:MAG: hypothetical protein DMD81_06245 [Candidatus Rokuibacteriota bacterium]|nr:MAG: hypothetical protein DMD81_06245 [Candidatus Rokubacteria bacterium]
MTALAALTPWLGPALLACVAAHAFSGDADAPVIVLLAVAAPLLALLRRSHGASLDRSSLIIAGPGLALLLWANALILVELARLIGIDRAAAALAAGALALIPLVVGGADDDWSGVIAACGVAGAAVAIALVGAAIGLPPWTAWTRAASRPALVFNESSLWVTQGNALPRSTTLEFTEVHRVTAVTAGTYRLIERDGGALAVRERQLNGGEALTLRPGDALLLQAGARVRFETGKRIPGPIPSGVSWSQPHASARPRAAVRMVGLAVTVIGAAVALVAPCRTRTLAIGGPLAVLAFALAGAVWGIYAMYAAPDLSVGAGPLTALVQLPPLVVEAHWAPSIVILIGVALLALYTAASCGLWHRMRDLAIPWSRRGLARLTWGIAVTLAAAAAWSSSPDPWTILLLGCGFLTSTVAAPALASTHPTARRIGMIAGATIFVLAAAVLAVRAPALGVTSIALIAGPVAWLTTLLMSRRV